MGELWQKNSPQAEAGCRLNTPAEAPIISAIAAQRHSLLAIDNAPFRFRYGAKRN